MRLLNRRVKLLPILFTGNEFDPLLLEVLKLFEVLVSCGFQCDTSQVSPELIKALRMLRDTQKQNIASTIEIRYLLSQEVLFYILYLIRLHLIT